MKKAILRAKIKIGTGIWIQKEKILHNFIGQIILCYKRYYIIVMDIIFQVI